ncbi:MAG: hypothetical protein M1826_000620 [Phylliscum demangeonii]|nr:MAG: hypothetical protein M1826_000620 [Phylliscum demangeonii]
MLDPVVFLLAFLLAAGAWALPQPATEPPSPHHAPDPRSLFPPGQVSELGKLGDSIGHPARTRVDKQFLDHTRRNPSLWPNYHAYDYALASQHDLIFFIMKMDDEFLACMNHQMAGPAGGPNFQDGKTYGEFDLYFAAEVCQIKGGRDLGIRFPRVGHYFAGAYEDAW